MLERKDVMPISFLKLEKFTGSSSGIRFRMEMQKPEEGDPALHVTVWPEPFAYDFTPEEKKTGKDFSFDEAGIEAGIAWINEMHDDMVGAGK